MHDPWSWLLALARFKARQEPTDGNRTLPAASVLLGTRDEATAYHRVDATGACLSSHVLCHLLAKFRSNF